MTDINSTDHAATTWKGAVDYVDDWFLMRSPWPVLTLTVVYVTFVLKWGPAYMEKRPAYQLRTALAFYNLFQVLLSGYIFYMGSWVLWNWGIVSSKCVIEGKDANAAYLVRGVYIYLLAKISELSDTVFFVLRKKMNQVSFLHVYHHTLMLTSTWLALKYNPTDAVIFLGTINSLVHIVMYGYYGLSAYPSLTKYLWWKKYLTKFQLVQFALIVLQCSVSTFVSSCQTSYILIYTIIFNAGLMIYLFSEFYIKSYIKKGTKVKVNGHVGNTEENSQCDKNGIETFLKLLYKKFVMNEMN